MLVRGMDWRLQDEAGLHAYKTWVGQQVIGRLQVGREQYGAGQPGAQFHGDPLKQGTEEAFDLPFYLHRAVLQRQAREQVMLECLDYIQNLENYSNVPERLFEATHRAHREELEQKIFDVLELNKVEIDEGI